MVYRQTLEIKNIWFKVIATLILSIIFMSFSFLNIFPVFPIQVSAVLFWAVSICFLTFYIGYLIPKNGIIKIVSWFCVDFFTKK